MLFMKFMPLFFVMILCSSAFALRCGSHLVEEGDRKVEVRIKCGDPLFTEHWESESATYITNTKDELRGDLFVNREITVDQGRTDHIEEWTYNFGPTRFIQYLTFINGRLEKIEDGPKGFSGDVLSGEFRPRCGYLVESGDRKIEVIIKCGDPYEIEYLWEERYSGVSVSVRKRKIPEFHRGDDNKYKREFRFIDEKVYEQKRSLVNVEEWTYNFGPRQFMYFIRFENGRVVKIEDGDYGF